MRKILLLVLILSLVRSSFATIEYLAANSWTKELCSFEQDDYKGFGWEPVGEVTEKTEKRYLSQGYTYAAFPHKIDYTFFGIVSATILTIVIREKRLKKNTEL